MPNCNFCKAPLTHIFCDLGHQPPSNAFLNKNQLEMPEIYYPLKVYVCNKCWLVQLPKCTGNLFTDDYPYYSSQSPSNVKHAREYVDMMLLRFKSELLNHNSHVLEIGSNDGYLLQWFVKKGIDCLGIDPVRGMWEESQKKGVSTLEEFFSVNLVKTKTGLKDFDLIGGINVLAHQPDINDFVEGLRIALKPGGVITMEFPHLMRLVEGNQFDTVYHEHYSYFSLFVICKVFEQHGLSIFDAEILPEHGGSLRIYAEHTGQLRHPTTGKVGELLEQELKEGIDTLKYYQGFQEKIEILRKNFLNFLVNLPKNKTIVAYGAPAKGNTFLNYCQPVGTLVSIPFTVDRSPYKQNKYLPGSHIRVTNGDELKAYRPDYVVILAWNLRKEIMEQLYYIREWGGKFIVAIPGLEVI